MTRIALIYGSISGLIVIGIITGGLAIGGGDGASGSEWFGYLIMVVALSMIFLGVKRYRDTVRGGVIKFLPAFFMGLAIAAVAGVVYVAVWEAYLASTGYTFADTYIEGVIEAKRAEGVSGAELEKLIADMDALKESYANPVFRVPITFMEIFPVGFVIALISAAILRNPNVLPARG